MLHNVVDALVPDEVHGNSRKKKEIIKGRVVLMKKNVLDFNDFSASIVDRFDELIGNKVSIQLVSSINQDPGFSLTGSPLFKYFGIIHV